ncbi:unnamed protein product, partial [Closterium sp. NIES-64]
VALCAAPSRAGLPSRPRRCGPVPAPSRPCNRLATALSRPHHSLAVAPLSWPSRCRGPPAVVASSRPSRHPVSAPSGG